MIRALFAGLSGLFGALLGGCSAVDVLNALVRSDTYSSQTAIAYGPSTRERLDVYVPRDSDASKPPAGYPIVVFFYGGSWSRGERADYRFVGEALASRGFIVVVPDYRLYPEVAYPAFLEDSARAVAWAHRDGPRYGGDASRLYVMGHSAGAYNAAMLALDARWLRPAGLTPAALEGWIGLAGPYDFLPSELPDVQSVFHHPDYPAGAQPIEHVTRDAPRAFLGAARTDNVVSPTRSTQQLADRLATAGVPVELVFYEHVNHYTLAGALARPLRFLAPVLDDVTSFIRDGLPADRRRRPSPPG